MDLSKAILGAWELVSYVEQPVDGSPPRSPLSDKPLGLILYTSDGYMSAQMMKPGRPQFAANDVFSGSPEECMAAVSGYLAYSGPFSVDEAEGVVRHSLRVSLFPNWLNGTQMRVVRLTGNELHLRSKVPFQSGGRLVDGCVTWRRALA